jgi:hypothetical protein
VVQIKFGMLAHKGVLLPMVVSADLWQILEWELLWAEDYLPVL